MDIKTVASDKYFFPEILTVPITCNNIKGRIGIKYLPCAPNMAFAPIGVNEK